MIEPKISLSLLVPGAGLLSSQECDKNSKESYNEHKMLIKFTKGKGKYAREAKKLLVIKTRKQKVVTQNISICEEAYHHMLETPTSSRMIKVWNTLTEHEKLKVHFDLIAHDLHAVSYSYEILGD